ncbi:MAG: hypothetical protein L0H29_07560, partial [Sinobacteraceae bacterium]|nr:hypothetical protein [Nevskiaceae bacterium]
AAGEPGTLFDYGSVRNERFSRHMARLLATSWLALRAMRCAHIRSGLRPRSPDRRSAPSGMTMIELFRGFY